VTGLDHLVCFVVHLIDSHTQGGHLSRESLKYGDRIDLVYNVCNKMHTCRYMR
jgi:hypothetical protein